MELAYLIIASYAIAAEDISSKINLPTNSTTSSATIGPIDSKNITLIHDIRLPSGAIPDGINPLFYASLIQSAPCPEYPSNENCRYPKTNLDPIKGPTWSCEEGNYCLYKNHTAKCNPGFYCPDDAAQPIYCPRGFYCDEDASTLRICPEDNYCPIGSTSPQGCHRLAYCPEGSHEASKWVVGLAFVVISIFISLLFFIKERSQLARELKHKKELELLIDPDIEPKPKLKTLKHTFDIEFRNLGLRLKNGIDIVTTVSGKFKSGRTCAIMGPSGSGKTTFLSILAGKIQRTSGEILINGNPEELSKYRKLVGFVPQDDIMLRELTVREILVHSARMRLPSNWKYRDIKTKVLDILSYLGLSNVANNVIGNEEIRGISGGQRKRVNIGIELVAEPSVLFLDEPTSGLDSSNSTSICQNLRSIAQQQGLTVAAVIHSPSPDTFREFDDLLLLGLGGTVVYFGPRTSALDYFDAIGFCCPDNTSPPDYFLDVISGKICSEFYPCFEPSLLPSLWRKFQRGILPSSTLNRMDHQKATAFRTEFLSTVMTAKRMELMKRKENSSFFGFISDGLSMIYAEFSLCANDIREQIGNTFTLDAEVRKTPSLLQQFKLLLVRANNQIYRNSRIILFNQSLHFASGVFISLAVQNFDFLGANPDDLCALAPWNVIRVCTNTVDKIKEAGMFIALGCLFAGTSIGVNTFGREKVVYTRDTASGMSTISYYMAKIISDIPRIMLGAATYTLALILVFPYRQNFLGILYIVMALYFYAFSIAYWISIVFSQTTTPLISTFMSLLFSIGLSGVIPTLNKVIGTDNPKVLDAPFPGYPKIFQLLWVLSPPRWAIEAFWLKEVNFRPFIEKTRTPPNHYSNDNYGKCFVYIGLITIFWHIISIIALKLLAFSKK